MKSIFHWVILAALVALVAGCSFALPPNIPLTGATPGAGTPQAGYPAGNPTAGGYPAGATNTPVLVTAVATATPAPTIALPTNRPSATLTLVPNNGDNGGTSGGTSGGSTGGSGNTSGGSGSIGLPAQRTAIQFPANAAAYVVNTNLGNGSTQAYQLFVSGGQRMYITIDGNAVMQLYDPNQNPLSGILTAINPVQISVSQTGNHYIVLQGAGPISMSVYVPPEGANQVVPAPVPANLTQVQFQPGATSTSFSVNAMQGTPAGYRLNVQAGQTMTVTTNGNSTIALLAPDGQTMVPSSNAPTHQWVFPLALGGNYTLVLLGSGAVNIKISIPSTGGTIITPQPSGTVTPVPKPGSSTRVTFGAGNASATVNTTLTAGAPQAYMLTIQAGQTLYVQTNGSVDVTAYGPDNSVVLTGRARYPTRWSIPANSTGDYTFVISGSGATQLVFFVPPR